MATSRRPATLDEARALAHPIRLRIVRLLHEEALTNRQLADRLSADPATTLHHVRTLLRSGFIEALPDRRGARGARERPYRATGKSWRLSFSGIDVPLAPSMVSAFVAEVAEAPADEVQVLRVALRLTAEQAADLGERLQEVVQEFVDRSDTDPQPDALPWAAFVAVHPRTEPGSA